MRFHNVKARLVELERLVSLETGNESVEFQLHVLHWLLREEEYRRFTRELFERTGEAGDADVSKLISAKEWEELCEWVERAESSIRADSRKDPY